jgi:lipopolysaccharide transport system permease protein
MNAVLAKVPFAAPLWQYRAFIWSAATREMRLQSMNSVLGWLWPVLNAAALILLYMTLFVEVLKSKLPGSDDSMSYAIYLCVGIITWTYFSNTIQRSLNIFGENAMLLKKAGFPKITLPIVVIVSQGVHFAIMMGVFAALLIVTGRIPGWSLLGMIPLLIIQQAIAISLGILLGTLNVFFRDVGQAVGIILTFWFWLTPIVYPLSILPPGVASFVTNWNPMTRIIEGYHAIALNNVMPHMADYIGHVVLAMVLGGLAYFCFKRLYSAVQDYL